MKKNWNITINILFIVLTGLFLIHPGPALSVCPAPSVTDYTAYPPFIVAGIKPNLLLMIDLEYIDKGRYTGTCTGGAACSNTVSCPTGQTCTNITFAREPFYCYDQTYNFNSKYAGYLKDWFVYYEYDFANDYFYVVPAPVWTSCNKYINGTL
jgi:hypothetical protein